MKAVKTRNNINPNTWVKFLRVEGGKAARQQKIPKIDSESPTALKAGHNRRHNHFPPYPYSTRTLGA
jgi:hypothetical protein